MVAVATMPAVAAVVGRVIVLVVAGHGQILYPGRVTRFGSHLVPID
jgi:hypothetical protein